MRRTQLSECLWAESAEGPAVDRIVLHGEIDIAGTPALVDLIDAVAGSTVVLDIGDVSFMGAAGAGTLVHMRHDLDQRGDALVVTGASPEIRRLLHLLQLDYILD